MEDLVLFEGEPLQLRYNKIYRAQILEPKDSKDARKISGGKNLVIARACEQETVRALFENKNIDMVIGLERYERGDSLHYRHSGLNQVLCALAVKNNIIVGFDVSSMNNSRILGRMMQNIAFCRKYKVRMALASFARDKFEMKGASNMLSLVKVLGMTAAEAQRSMHYSDI